MEKAKLLVAKKDEAIELKLLFPKTNEEIPLSNSGIIGNPDLSWNNKKVDVFRIGDKIVKVQIGRKEIYQALFSGEKTRPFNSSRSGTQRQQQAYRNKQQPQKQKMVLKHVEKIGNPAHAPYNFVPLNAQVVAIDPPPDFNRYYQNRYTGWIDLEIETKTPLYIRGTLTEEEIRAGTEAKDISTFFSPGGKLRIPGSSLRGMVRTLVEIVSYGKFGPCDDNKLLYYRGLADKSNLRKEYQEKMSSYDRKARKSVYKVSAGVLQSSNGLDYEIIPSEKFRPILKQDAKARVQAIDKPYSTFNFYTLAEGYLIVSGDMQNKKRDWLIEFPKAHSKQIAIHSEDVRNYRNDTTRAEEVPNLLELAAKGLKVPCFYVRWKDSLNNDRVSFGHTAMFRLAYEKTIREHIPLPEFKITEKTVEKLQQQQVADKTLAKLNPLLNREFTKTEFISELVRRGISKTDRAYKLILTHAMLVDFAEAIFGNEKTFAGRVFFEDACLGDGQTDVLMGNHIPKILASPKPTTFQHYLVQTSDNNRQLNHYNTYAPIRGNKLYWHKSGEDWVETDKEAIDKHKTQYTTINPVKPGIKFTGRIRFENLSDEELGALLFILELPKDCYHKIGMGKPLGLGTIQITPKLYLSSRQQRYTDLFSEWKSELAEPVEIQPKKVAFETYMLGQLGQEEEDSLWKTDRLQELETMLNYKKGLERQMKNIYMQISPQNEFKDRLVLPKPSKI